MTVSLMKFSDTWNDSSNLHREIIQIHIFDIVRKMREDTRHNSTSYKSGRPLFMVKKNLRHISHRYCPICFW